MRFMTRESLRSEGPINLEVRFIRWDGDVRNALLTITRVPGTQKLVVAIHGYYRQDPGRDCDPDGKPETELPKQIIRHDILNHLTVLKGNLGLDREINH